MSILRFASLLLSLCLFAVGCGGRVLVDPAPAPVQPKAVALFLGDGAGCVAEPPVDTAADVIAPADSSDAIAVVDISFAEECTGAGGQYVLAREIDGFRYFWLGGHGCYFLDQAPSGTG